LGREEAGGRPMMGGWIFWMLVGFLIWRFVLRGRCWRGAERRPVRTNHEESSYVDALETRVSDLEERLDFTERLLAGRQEVGAG
jgi:hypothetical protein